jgi:HAD superfamily hydrolase (TIGR01509 family)
VYCEALEADRYVDVMPDPPALVIFDCDGVLVESERIAVKVDQHILDSVGITMSETEIIERFMGRSTSVMFGFIEEQRGRPIPVELRQQWASLYREAFERELIPVAGIQQALAQLSQPKCVASSSGPASLHRKLEITGLLPYFEGRIYSASQVANGKPAPDLFLFAADQMGFAPPRCAVVEDSQYGVSAALAAGMTVFGYGGGITPTESLAQPGVTIFNDMRELPALMGSSD